MAFVDTTLRDLSSVKSNIETAAKNADHVRILSDSDLILLDRIKKQWFDQVGVDETFNSANLDQDDKSLSLLFAYHGIASVYRSISNDTPEPDSFERLSDKYFSLADELFNTLKASGFPYNFETIVTDDSAFAINWQLVRI